MSEQNILNPSTTSPLNPDYSVKITDPQVAARWQARSGKAFFRRLAARGKMFDLTWNKRLFADYQTLRQWFAQYENDYFTFADYDQSPTRYCTGMFADQPTVSRDGNNQVTIQGQFVEVPGLPMYQYPSAWGVDSILLEEQSGFGPLVKLTGTQWDRKDQNYCLWSQDFTQAAWVDGTGVTIDAGRIDPNGGTTANGINYSGTGAAGGVRVSQNISTPQGSVGLTDWFLIASVWLRSVSGATAVILANGLGGSTVCNLTTNWQRFQLTGQGTGAASMQISVSSNVGDNSAFTVAVWGAQYEFGSGLSSTASTYTATTSATVALANPVSNALYHGGFAFNDLGQNTTDAAEWSYFGYGFRLWAPKTFNSGIGNLYLDGSLLGNIDFYAAADTNSAVVWTQQSVPLGMHRVKITSTNTANGSSFGFRVWADALEAMR